MQDLELHALSREKVTAYRREADLVRRLPKRSWRSHTAHVLRSLADGLERQPAPALS